MLQPGLRLSGRMVFDGGSPPLPADWTAIRFRLADVNGSSTIGPQGRGRADGTLEITDIVPGVYRMTSPPFGADWRVRSIVIAGQDVLDVPLEIGAGRDISGAIATFTDRHTEVSGTLQTAAGVAATDYFVVLFSSDRTFWRPASRRVRFTRPSTDGRFAFRDLPGGEYLIAALTDMEPADLDDPAFIERLVPAGVAVRLNDGEKKTQDLRIAR